MLRNTSGTSRDKLLIDCLHMERGVSHDETCGCGKHHPAPLVRGPGLVGGLHEGDPSLPLAEQALVFSLESGKELFPVFSVGEERRQLLRTAPLDGQIPRSGSGDHPAQDHPSAPRPAARSIDAAKAQNCSFSPLVIAFMPSGKKFAVWCSFPVCTPAGDARSWR